DLKARVLLSQRDADPAAAGIAELHRIRQQIEQYLNDAVEIGGHRRHALRKINHQLNVFFPEQLAHSGHRVDNQLLQVDARFQQLRRTGFDLGQVQDLVDQARQAGGFLGDNAEKVPALRELNFRILEQ